MLRSIGKQLPVVNAKTKIKTSALQEQDNDHPEVVSKRLETKIKTRDLQHRL